MKVSSPRKPRTQVTAFFQDVGETITSFIGATANTVKSTPVIVGINLSEAEEEAEPHQLMKAVADGSEKSSGSHGKLASFAFMPYVLTYTPYMVAIAAEHHELGTKWMWFNIVFQGGRLLELG